MPTENITPTPCHASIINYHRWSPWSYLDYRVIFLRSLCKAWSKRQFWHRDQLKCQTLDDFIAEFNRVEERSNNAKFYRMKITELAENNGISSDICWAIFIRWILKQPKKLNEDIINSVLPDLCIEPHKCNKIEHEFNRLYISSIAAPTLIICS